MSKPTTYVLSSMTNEWWTARDEQDFNEPLLAVDKDDYDKVFNQLMDAVKRLDTASTLLKETHYGASGSIDQFVEKILKEIL